MQNLNFEEKEEEIIDGSKHRCLIIISKFHEELAEELLENTKKELLRNKVKEENIHIVEVAGTLEIPYACNKLISSWKVDVVITLGVVIRGETSHYDLVNETTFKGLMDIQVKNTKKPIIFGIITTESFKQAKERISENGFNKGKSFAQAVLIQKQIKKP